jgi:hypothetical protein
MSMSMQVLAIISLLTAISLPPATLTTSSYDITIEVRSSEGNVTCDDVRYTGTSRKSGRSIRLRGKTVHTHGTDGVTPSHFLGYAFKNGRTTYFVGEDGELRVTRGSKVLIEEIGVWQ